jgi:hypothetical protein
MTPPETRALLENVKAHLEHPEYIPKAWLYEVVREALAAPLLPSPPQAEWKALEAAVVEMAAAEQAWDAAMDLAAPREGRHERRRDASVRRHKAMQRIMELAAVRAAREAKA